MMICKRIHKKISLVMTIVLLFQLWGVHITNAYDKSTIQKELIKRLYGGANGSISCDFDGYVSTEGRHEGIDFRSGIGNNVYALTEGEITYINTGFTGSSGLSTIAIYLQSFNKTVIYLHTAPTSTLKVGQTIKQNDLIATESWRGISSANGAHTHVEVVNGRETHAKISVLKPSYTKGSSKYIQAITLENDNPYGFWELYFNGPNPKPNIESAIDCPSNGDNLTDETFRIQGWVLSSNVTRATFSVNGGEEHEMSLYWRDDVGGTGFLAEPYSYQHLGFGGNDIKIRAYLSDGTVVDVGTRNVVRYAAFAVDTPTENAQITDDQFNISGWIRFGYAGWDISRVTIAFNNGDEKDLNLYTREDVLEATAFLGTFDSISNLNYGDNSARIYVYYSNGIRQTAGDVHFTTLY